MFRRVLAASSLGLLMVRRSLSESILVRMVVAIFSSMWVEVLVMRPRRQVMYMTIMAMMPAGIMESMKLVSQSEAGGVG